MNAGSVLGTAVFLLGSCAFGQNLYRSADGSFSIQVPDGWQTQRDETSGLTTDTVSKQCATAWPQTASP